MATQLTYALEGKITKAMKEVAEDENYTPEEICEKVKSGKIVIPINKTEISGQLELVKA